MARTCVSCGADQLADARFCSACGAPLGEACPVCGADAPAGAAFCSSCGASLTTAATATPRGAAVDERNERRVVTVLFADLAGSTALAERIDPEELRVLQGELFALVNAEVERFGGLSEKFVGDAVLAVFGVPLAHDDDAERAVRAALAVRDRFPQLARDVQLRHGVEIGLRIGVNTGEVVAGRDAAARGELMVTGDAVNVGARLQQRAEPGQVLVGERTYGATRRAVDYASAGPAPAKGKREPVVAWEALAVVAPPGTRGAEGLSAPMIGREEELVVLDALATRVERERAPQLVTAYGQAGVGKTRLVTEFVAALDGARVLHGRCLPYGEGITYWPLGEAAKGYAGILDSDPADDALAKLETVVAADVPAERAGAIVEALGWTIALGLPDDEDRDLRAGLRDAWGRFLTDLGRGGLTVLVVEDVHWASEPLLELLEHVTESLVDTAVLTICTARHEFLDARPGWGAGLRDSTSIRLSSLPDDESVRLVDALLGAEDLPRELTERIVSRAEGNPFHVEEILQMLIDRGALVREDGRWTPRAEILGVDLPDSVHGVIAARVDLLEPASRDALRRCSPMGRVFWPAAVGVSDEPIAALARRGLVTEHASSTIEGMREFSFKHALTQDVVYASLPRTERRELHRRVGGWIEAMARGREAEVAEIAAYHYDQALAYGDTSPETRGRCFRLLLAAGGAALARAAGESARRLFERAGELAADPDERTRALIGLGRAELLVSGSHRALDVLARASTEAGETGDARLVADALGLYSRANWLAGRYGEAMRAATAAVDALDGHDETPQLARAVARLSQLEMLSGLPGAEQRAHRALEVARRVGDAHAELNARINLVVTGANHGTAPDVAEAQAIIERAIETGDAPEAHRCLVNTLWAAQAFVSRAELEATLETLRRPLASVPAGEDLDRYFELSYVVLVDLPACRWEAADAVRRPMWPSGEMVWHELRGGMALRRGDLAAAAQPLGELRVRALESGEPQRLLPMASVVLPYAFVTGDRKTLVEVVDAVVSLTDREWGQLPVTSIPRAVGAAGENELLERVSDLLTVQRETADAPRLAIAAFVASGLVSLAAGHASDAVEQIRDAAEWERRLGWPYRAACLDLDLARALDAAGAERDADVARTRAAAILGPLRCVHAY
jgi:class 3 adenylate cyclase